MGKKGKLDDMGFDSGENLMEKYKVAEITAISNGTKPKDNIELKSRIATYFQMCREYNLRPGIENLCLAIGVNRSTLMRWCRGDGADEERQEIAISAKAVVVAFLEAAAANGKINPAFGIFMLKNWANYKDNEPLAVDAPIKPRTLLAERIIERYALDMDAERQEADFEALPFAEFIEEE